MGTASKVLVGAVVVGVAGFLWHSNCRTSQAEVASREALTYVPADAQVVVSFDVQQLRNGPGWKSLSSRLEADPAYRAMSRACGVDVLDTFPRVTIAVREIDPAEGVLVMQGKQLNKLADCMAKDTELVREGNTWLGKDHDGKVALRLVDDATLVAVFGSTANAAELDEVIARTPKSVTTVDSFQDLYKDLDTSGTAWFVVRGKALRDIPFHAPRAIAGSLDIGTKITGRVVVRFEDAGDAERMMRFGDELKKQVRDSMLAVTRDGADIRVKVEISADDTKRLLERAGVDF